MSDESADKTAGGGPTTLQAPAELGAADASWLRGTLGYGVAANDALTTRTPIHWWALDAVAGDAIHLDLTTRTRGGDTYVIVYRQLDSGYALVGYNDDCAGSLNSCLDLALDTTGRYLVGTSSYRYSVLGRATRLSYSLLLTCHNASGTCNVRQQACGSRGLGPCPDGQYCNWSDATGCGFADGPGVCAPRPEIHTCTRINGELEVCGCDGQTYVTACFAAANGVDVNANGTCPDGQGVGETCGGIAAFQCADGLECDYSNNTSCNIADMGGVCRVVESHICPLIYRPECGCDGHTYGNSCQRHAGGVPLDHAGPCEGRGVGMTCGGIANLQCDAGLACDYSGVTGCDIADVAGVCAQEVGVICTMEYNPVCGCNGVTYSNDCARRGARVALDHAGACR